MQSPAQDTNTRFPGEAGEGCGVYSHAVDDLDEDAAVLELQHGLHRAGHMQTVHLQNQRSAC